MCINVTDPTMILSCVINEVDYTVITMLRTCMCINGAHRRIIIIVFIMFIHCKNKGVMVTPILGVKWLCENDTTFGVSNGVSAWSVS